MSVKNLMRRNIVELDPYRCARDEFEGSAEVYLDANESWRDYIEEKNINRYPDPHSSMVRKALEEVLGFPYEKTIVGNGSDELIDLMFRVFCEPGKDSVLLLPPTYGAYKVFASINDVKIQSGPLSADFQLDEEAILGALDEYKPKLLFICSPNNPTGNKMDFEVIRRIAAANSGITVVDEAYYDFSDGESALSLIDENERVVLLRTLSKAWALAGARIGICVSSKEIHDVLYNVKYPYNLSLPAQTVALNALLNADKVREGVIYTIKERAFIVAELSTLPSVSVLPSDANFLLARMPNAYEVYRKLIEKGIIVRFRGKELGCENCLRITIGSREENLKMLDALKEILG